MRDEMIEQRAREFLLLDHFGADESKRLADFAEREVTPYREALRALVEALRSVDDCEASSCGQCEKIVRKA